MNVLIVSEPGVDGVFRYVEALCHFLAGQGVGVHLAYSDRRGSDRLLELVAWIEEHGGRTVNLRTSNRPAFSDWAAFRSLIGLARMVKPDVIHSHSSKAGFLARLLPLCGIGAVQIYNPHAYVGMRPKAGKLDWLYNMIERFLGRTAYTIVTSSTEESFAIERLKIPRARVCYRPNGVDTDWFAPVSPEKKRQLRGMLGLPVHQPILGFLGRSSAQKDPVTLYRAFARASAGKPIALFHVGKGELDHELDLLVERLGLGGRVFRRPYMSTPVDFFRAVDGFILTSRYEGLSLAALEALACDLPMILSEAPGNVDLLAQPLSHVWSARAGDVGGFARGITGWYDRLQNPSAINHRQIARSQFDLRERLGSVLELYGELTGAVRASHHTTVEAGAR